MTRNRIAGFLSLALVSGLPLAAQAAEGGLTLSPTLAISSRVGAFRIALNAGFRWRSQATELIPAPNRVVIKDEVFARLALGYRLELRRDRQFRRRLSVHDLGTWAE